MKTTHTNVYELAEKLDLWQQVRIAVPLLANKKNAAALLQTVSGLPVQGSRATRTLGSYVSRAGKPVAIRLQFDQEPELLKETFLHELAHVCDHLTRRDVGSYRRAHGPSWKRWAAAFGIEARVKGRSPSLEKLYSEKLKPVAVCCRCGAVIERARKLNHRHRYVHRTCGGKIKALST